MYVERQLENENGSRFIFVYWANIIKRAASETCAKAKFDTVSNASYVLIPMLVGAFIVFIGTNNVPWGALGAAGGLAAISAVYFFARLLMLPPTVATETEARKNAELAEIARQRDELQAYLAVIVPGQNAAQQEQRNSKVRQLVHLYIDSNDGIPSSMRSGLKLPPEKWLNAQLAHQGHNWRVRDLGQGNFDTYDVTPDYSS